MSNIKHFAKRLLLPISITLAVASCQQPSATTTSPTPSVAASPQASPSQTASASPKTESSAAPSSAKTEEVDAFIKADAESKEMYDETGGVKFVSVVEKETCRGLDAGVPFRDVLDVLVAAADKQGRSMSMSAEKLTKVKEYTAFVALASVNIACPQHKDKTKT